MTEMVARWRKTVYFAGLGAGLLVFLYQVWRSVEGVGSLQIGVPQLQSFVTATGIIVFAYLLQMIVWMVLLRGLGYPVEVCEVLGRYVLAFLPRYIPGSVWGYLGRGEWLKTRCGVPYAASAASSVLEVGIGLLTALVVAGASYLGVTWQSSAKWLVIVGGLMVAWVSWRLYDNATGLVLASRTKWTKLLLIAQHRVGIGTWMTACLIYYVFWFCYGAAVTTLLPQSVEGAAVLLSSTMAYTLAWTAGFLILFVPSGLGAREAALSAVLVWQTALTAPTAGAVSIAVRGVVLAAEAVWLLVGLSLSGTRALGNVADPGNPEHHPATIRKDY